MMSKAPRWPDLVANNRSNTQKKGGKDPLTAPASGSSGGSKVAGSSIISSSSSLLKPRSKSQTRVSDTGGGSSSSSGSSSSTAAKAGDGSVKGGSLGRYGSRQLGARRDSGSRRPSLRLCSSRSFSSLHTPSLTAAPFMRSSRSLTRLDHRTNTQDSDHGVSTRDDKKGQSAVKRLLNSRRLSSSDGHIRDNKDVSHGDDVEKMKTSSSSEQTKDGVSSLCAKTSGKKRNWVQSVLKNVRSSPSADVSSSHSGQKPHCPESETPEVVEPKNQDAGEKVEGSNPGESGKEEEEPQPQEGDVTTGTQQVEEEDDNSSSDQCPTTTGEEVSVIEEEEGPWPSEQEQTVHLVRELEQTQRELCRLQQLNKNLQDEQERRSIEALPPQDPSEQAVTIQRLQKLNHELCVELETQKRSHEEARETELQRRVDLLAQQAQLLVTGDATALAQAHLEHDRRRFRQQQMESESRLASLASQLSSSEEKRKEAESRLRQEQRDHAELREEAESSRLLLEEAEAQRCLAEEAQAEKEAQLQKHLVLLQASQDRERRSLAASLEEAEVRSRELQEKLDQALEQVESLSKTRAWTREIEEAQQQLQEELGRTVSAVQALHEERERLDRRCQELQGQLSEAEAEARGLQSRLETDETQYYDLEHLYERACEELQVALGKVEQREAETQEMREGYERLLDGKEQELSEVLLKMEVLGNSLEETEVKLNQVMRDSARPEVEEGEPARPPSAGEETGADSADVPLQTARARSRSVDPSYQCIVTATDDPDRFISVIQLLERKLYVSEERLRDITQRLEEQQSQAGGGPDPQLYAQLTQSRATVQHLGLLLHSQARQSHRFALEAEGRCRTLAGRFQMALNIVHACRNRLQVAPPDHSHLEKQLAAVASCLQQGQTDAETQQRESRNASKGEEKILGGDAVPAAGRCPAGGGVRKCLVREIFVIEKILSVLQSHRAIAQISAAVRDDDRNVAQSYKSIVSQILVLRSERKSRKAEADGDGHAEVVVGRGCAEAELVYAALKVQQRFQSQEQAESLADVNPPELAPYEEQVKAEEDKEEQEKEPEWLRRLAARLQRRAKFLTRLCHEISDGPASESGGEDADADKDWMQEQARLIYLSERLQLDLDQELLRNQAQQNQQRKEPDAISIPDEQETLARAACRLQDENGALREELQRAQQRAASADTGNQRLLEDIQKIEEFHQDRMQTLENKFQEKIRELQQIHEEEMRHLHGFYTKERQRNCDSVALLKQGEPENQGLSAAEETHRKLIVDLQQQHQAEVASLLQEKEQLLQEETAATMAAIVAMRRAHKQELEKSRQTQHIRESADITQMHIEYEKELQSLHKELEVLSLQHTQKCLENTQLSHELQSQRRSSGLRQQENKQREIEEMAKLHFSSLNGKHLPVIPQTNDFYEMEVILRAREAEMQFLRQEAGSLREELKIARMDKIYAQNKLKALYSSGQDGHDVNNLNSDDFTWSANRDTAGQSLKDFMTNTVFVKKTEKPLLTRTFRGVRSKSLKDGLSVQEKMKLFESF